MQTVVAGFGNVLRGDDGFGVEVVRRLQEEGAPAGVRLLDIGTGGVRLAQDLLTPCDRLIIADAMQRGGAPGTVYVLDVQALGEIQDIDMHAAMPAQALAMARALGVLPPVVLMIGCEPAEIDELRLELSAPVRAGVDEAVRRIQALLGADGCRS